MSSYSVPTTIPKSLAYFSNRLANYSRQRAQLLMMTSTSASTGQSFTVELPPNALIDLDTLMMSFTATTTGAGKVGYQSATDLFHSITVEVNGKIVQDLQYFNQLANLYTAYQGSSKTNVNKILLTNTGFDPSLNNAPAVGTANNHALFGTSWLGILGSIQPRVWDSNIIGSTKITFRVAGSEAFATDTSGTAPGVSLSNIRFEVDVLQLDGIYYDVVNRTLSGGGVLELPFQHYTTFIGQSQAGNNATINFSLATQSLDAVVATAFDNTGGSKWKGYGLSALDTTDKTKAHIANYFKKGNAEITDTLLQLNNQSYPAYGKSPIISDCVMTINNLLGYNPLASTAAVLDTQQEFKEYYFAKVVRLNHPDEGRLMSGMNTLGANMQGNFTLYTSGTNALIPAVICMTTSTLQVGQGRQVNVLN
jgi:hypothetical protein